MQAMITVVRLCLVAVVVLFSLLGLETTLVLARWCIGLAASDAWGWQFLGRLLLLCTPLAWATLFALGCTIREAVIDAMLDPRDQGPVIEWVGRIERRSDKGR